MQSTSLIITIRQGTYSAQNESNKRIRFINGSGFRECMITRKRSQRKSTTGRYHDGRKKRQSELGRLPTLTKVGDARVKQERVRGGIIKRRVLQSNTVNLFDGKKFMKATIKNVVENLANRNFIRRNIITKGAVVETDKGKVKITSRPGQAGTLNAVLVK